MKEDHKSFSTVEEFLKAYFPADDRQKFTDFTDGNCAESGVAWALKMAEKYAPKRSPRVTVATGS